jgi:hypothetical protein
MRVLAHVHTFNVSGVIGKTIEALLRQTRPVDGILVVDNASTDGTLDRPSSKICCRFASPRESGDERRRFLVVSVSRWSEITIGFGCLTLTAFRRRTRWRSGSKSTLVGRQICKTRRPFSPACAISTNARFSPRPHL